jgi:hypothetical protein
MRMSSHQQMQKLCFSKIPGLVGWHTKSDGDGVQERVHLQVQNKMFKKMKIVDFRRHECTDNVTKRICAGISCNYSNFGGEEVSSIGISRCTRPTYFFRKIIHLPPLERISCNDADNERNRLCRKSVGCLFLYLLHNIPEYAMNAFTLYVSLKGA